jgi:hypothetical protein
VLVAPLLEAAESRQRPRQRDRRADHQLRAGAGGGPAGAADGQQGEAGEQARQCAPGPWRG